MPNKMILIMGLPGSGKTTFAEKVVSEFKARQINPLWYNADVVRKQYDDWDFSDEGRLRQAKRMRKLVNESVFPYNIVDMVAPTEELRKILKPDLTVWMNTIEEGRFEDTNQLFSNPTEDEYQVKLTGWGSEHDAKCVVDLFV